MNAILLELVTYLIKYIVFLTLAVFGIIVGGKIRKNKNAKLVAENTEELK